MPDTLTESMRFDVHLPSVRFARVAANAVADSAPQGYYIYTLEFGKSRVQKFILNVEYSLNGV